MPSPGPGVSVDNADIDTCLRVLAEASKTDPGDPRWARVHQAAAQVHRAGKKARKAARHADRRLHDRELLSGSTRYREQEPPLLPTAPGVPSAPDRRLLGARRCYVCKSGYRDVHPDYHLVLAKAVDAGVPDVAARAATDLAVMRDTDWLVPSGIDAFLDLLQLSSALPGGH